ncbi:NIPSNAP family protein [Subtercola boreus]|uniref:NIPSNAP domain-containing protein n=1 Tax=Subtercola boreus TaxID=120213 RepID=A0A3E0WFW1_9MICO|nr:NIPSNAP family protein [Subtercola boreus]RFA22726.1 hypothetical protein B7R24_03725 [Subtercola boreus]RFA23081.1 hypothetical protein B7R23_03720 [Subtercola boreus]RFA28834.1 hypothetical protein B7R25_03735 [Subtercola boreus]
MKTYELRTYWLSTPEAAQAYVDTHWPRHIPSLSKFGITTRGIWLAAATEYDPSNRVVALVSYADGIDPAAASADFMGSADFREDMAGFSPADILRVEAVALEPAAASPLA